MKGSIGIGRSLSVTRRASFVLQSSSFSTSSSGFGGGGRGRGGGASPSSPFFEFTRAPGKSDSDVSKQRDSAESPPIGLGHGRGRGRPLSSNPVPHPIPSFVSQTGSGRGRGGLTPDSVPQPPQPPGQPKQPIFIRKKDDNATDFFTKPPASESVQSREPTLPSGLFSESVVSGAGRGKPTRQPEQPEPAVEENRHIRVRQQPPQQQMQQEQRPPPPKQPPLPQPNLEDAAKRALGMLSRGDREESGMASGGGRAGDRGRGRGRKQGEGDRILAQPDEGFGQGLYLGNPEDAEKFAKAIGPEKMSKLAEAFEEMGSILFPSPMEDAFVDAFHTNCSIECEPEYLMGDFETNPDIDEKPPIPLRDALEKMKPFLMPYEGIQSQEEWEEVMKETMEVRVPILQEIVDYYSGPDRVTAKKQQEELETVAKTIPQSAPTSVKRFANRAVLSLQSNPGWGFDKKCQFMDKLVREVSQQYK